MIICFVTRSSLILDKRHAFSHYPWLGECLTMLQNTTRDTSHLYIQIYKLIHHRSKKNPTLYYHRSTPLDSTFLHKSTLDQISLGFSSKSSCLCFVALHTPTELNNFCSIIWPPPETHLQLICSNLQPLISSMPWDLCLMDLKPNL